MWKLKSLWNLKYLAIAYAGIAFGLAGMALAAHPSNDRCRAETHEKWDWTGMFSVTFVSETWIRCVDDGCQAAQGSCSGPFQYGAVEPYQDGQGETQTITRYYCNCVDVTDHGSQFGGSQHCEAIIVEDSGISPSDPDRVSRECLNLLCADCSEEFEYEPHGAEPTDPPAPPIPFVKIDSCACVP